MGNKKQFNNKINIAICDDERIISNEISELVKTEFKKEEIEVKISVFEKGEEILNINNIHYFDVIFLDIELKTTNGLEIANKLRDLSYNNLIVFITSFIDYVFDGYKTEAFRFILKNNMGAGLSECVSAIAKKLKSNKHQINAYLINVRDVLYASSDNRTITVYFKNKKTKSAYMKLNDFEKKLNSKLLCRVHQSYLINIDCVEFIARHEITLIDGSIIPVSKSRYKQVNKHIKLRKALWT